ncbi:hypothetical protein HOG48_03235 [Candidatus Peregrinibacteria bacterium]|jgi:hypothetical protein|nr:hypothetical protein [Candidatus Peregrinibacteria bacterium]
MDELDAYEDESSENISSESIDFMNFVDKFSSEKLEAGTEERRGLEDGDSRKELEEYMARLWEIKESQVHELLDSLVDIVELSTDKEAIYFLDACLGSDISKRPTFEDFQTIIQVVHFLYKSEKKTLEEIIRIISNIPLFDLASKGDKMVIEALKRGEYEPEEVPVEEEEESDRPNNKEVREMISLADKITVAVEDGADLFSVDLIPEEAALRADMNRMLFNEVYVGRLAGALDNLSEDASYRDMADILTETVLADLPSEYQDFGEYSSMMSEAFGDLIYEKLDSYEEALENGDEVGIKGGEQFFEQYLEATYRIVDEGGL